jgi:hypothetical protein
METTDPMVLAAFREQEEQRAAEADEGRPALYALQQIPPPELLALARELRRSEDVRERELAAWLIGQSPLPATTISDEVREALATEEDPEVICRLIWALVYAPAADMLPELERLAAHRDDRVRFPVPDALSRCAPRFEAIEMTLMQLSSDPDPDVRWSAAFELGAWLEDSEDLTTAVELARILSRLRDLAGSDPDDEVRALATQRVSEAEQSN